MGMLLPFRGFGSFNQYDRGRKKMVDAWTQTTPRAERERRQKEKAA